MHRNVGASPALFEDAVHVPPSDLPLPLSPPLLRPRRLRAVEGSGPPVTSPARSLSLSSRGERQVQRNDMDELSADLLARFRAGDESAFEAMFRAYAAPLCDFAMYFTRSREQATEVVHDVFLLVWARRDRLDVRTNLRAYLYRATRNRALEVRRRDTFFRRWVERTTVEQADDESARLAPTPHEQFERDEQAAALRRAIDALPERRRMVLLLRWRDGMRNEQVAELMGISVKTVENQITQALRTLREQLFHDRG